MLPCIAAPFPAPDPEGSALRAGLALDHSEKKSLQTDSLEPLHRSTGTRLQCGKREQVAGGGWDTESAFAAREIEMQSHPFLVFLLSCSPLGKDCVYKNTDNWHMLET